MTEASVRAVFVASVLAMSLYVATHVEFSTDITNFMPAESHTELAMLASRLADSQLTRTMILTIGAPEIDAAVAAARSLTRRLESHPEVAWLRTGIDPEQLESMYRIYFPRRHRFLAEHPETEIPELTEAAALRARARKLRETLALPTATLTKRIAGVDPLGAFERIVERLRTQGRSLRTHEGQFVTEDGLFAVIFLATSGSAFDSRPQEVLLRDIEAGFREVVKEQGGPLVLEASGANRFAVAAERSIRGDVALIGTISFLGVAVVFLAFLRSLHFFCLAVLPPLFGILTAATATQLIFGRLDGLTMAFGASLIGVAIDYSIHVIDHQRLTPEVPASTIVRRLRPSLLLGASTTMASFAGLMLTSFPGFREIGVFSIVGVGASLVATLAVLPGLLGNGSRARPVPELARRTARALGSAVVFLAPHRRWLACVPIVCLGAMTVFVPRIGFVDDLSRLMAMDPDLRAEEDRVRARVARMSESRVVVALADDTAAAVALNDRVAERLAAARDAGVLEEFRSLHALLWSEALQDRNLAALDAVPDLADRVETAFVAEGFRAAALAGFREALDSPAPPPLRAEDLVNSPLGDLVSPLLLPLGDRVAVVTYLSGVSSAGALTHALEGLEHVHVFDQRSFLNAIYREFRITTLEQMALGSALVILVLGLRYRRWRPALAALLPSLFVAGSLLALFGAFGVEINLLHVTSLILVMGMGVDYGIFVVDAAVDRPSLDATMLSLLLSCLTTVFVFGTLALSEHPALRAIGLTTGLGILLSFVLAPVTLLLVHRADPVHAS